MIYCSNCGSKILNNAKFCSNCGAKSSGIIEEEHSTSPSAQQSSNYLKSSSNKESGLFNWIISNSLLGVIFNLILGENWIIEKPEAVKFIKFIYYVFIALAVFGAINALNG